jgi:hypothetical protein
MPHDGLVATATGRLRGKYWRRETSNAPDKELRAA